MGISSFNMQTSSANSSAHMKRDSYVSYLIDYSNNGFEYKYYLDSKEYLEFAKLQTKLLTKRKMQSLAIDSFVQEAVINIEEHHTIEDIENLFKNLNKKFNGGFKLFDVAIHKDEGVFIQSKHNVNDLIFNSKTLKIYKDDIDVTNDVISFAPNKDIFYNPDNKKWYKEKAFKNEFDTSKLQIKYNLHAHANFTKWEESTGKNIRTQKNDMQKIQDITAECLGMQRGEINSNTKRMNHYQLKKLYSDNNEIKKVNVELLATIQELKKANAELKAELQTAKAKRPEHAQLEQLNKELTIKLKNKDLTIEEMNIRFSELKNKLLKEKNEALESVKSTIISSDEEKTAYKQNIEELKKEIMEKDDLIFSLKVNYGKLEKEKEHLEAVIPLKDLEIIDLKSLNEMKPKEVEKIVEVVKIERVEKIVEVPVIKEVENPINTQLQKENEELKELKADIAKVINIPVERNFSFLVNLRNIFYAFKEQIESLQAQIRVLTTKDTVSSAKTTPEPIVKDYLADLVSDYEKISEEKEKEAVEELFGKKRDDYK